MEWVGHSDLAMILRYYALQDEQSKRAMAAVNFGDGSLRSSTVLAQSGGTEKEPRPQPPVFKIVANAAS